MMQAYLHNKMDKQVIKLFFYLSNEMYNAKESRMIDDYITYVLALKACANIKDVQGGKEIHRYILKNRKYYDCNNQNGYL